MTAIELYRKYLTDQFEDFLEYGTKAETKEQYLDWVKSWKAKYHVLSDDIRKMKGMRKENKYKYRDQSVNDIKRRIVIGKNPDYDEYAYLYTLYARRIAVRMLNARHYAKIESWKRKLASDEAKEAA